ncbi:MAG: hypothetical protein HN886_00630 [Woeseiaceae bacterium]|jgi:hypothetical protein|nr:hypothetical protein [Woeseiaceae bacterium]
MKYVITLFSFLLAGLFILPFIFFAINDFIFGKYAGEGFTGYYIEYFKMLRGGSLAAWFISLSPYLVYVIIKITFKIKDKLT